MKILMVCLGNICRSPIAEGVLQALATQHNLHWVVESAGTNRFHTGEAPHKSSQKVCLEQGIDISKQRARTFVAEDFDRYDHIYALATDVMADIKMISKNRFDAARCTLLMDVLEPGKEASITDPWYGGEDGYYPVFNQIKQCCEAIIQQTLNA
jgi:protein-tyrosine phosphatase